MNFEIARHNMVESQIRPNQVTDDRVIAAMSAIPRELFVPEALASVAYVDEALGIGGGRHLMEPMILARLIQESRIGPDDLALVVGCGSGYSAAAIAHVAGTVVALEEDDKLVATATRMITELDIDNAAVIAGPLADGYPAQAPYDVIIFGGAVAQIPEQILAQLSDGGRLAAIRMGEKGMGKGILVTNIGGAVTTQEFLDGSTPLLPGFEAANKFEF